ncbi:MAG: fatty acyl-AMP ligase [Pseudomonadota bacterium]
MNHPTPTDSGIALRLGNFRTLTDALDYAATGATGINIYQSNGTMLDQSSYAQLAQEAQDLGRSLAGFAPRGTLIGLLAQTSIDFARLFFAAQYAGLIPVPMPLPTTMGGRETYEAQIRKMVQSADIKALFVPSRLTEIGTRAMAGLNVPVLDLANPDLGTRRGDLQPHKPGDLCYIQYSSGSTNDPKGVIGSQESVTANCEGIITHGLQVQDGDRAVSWLPLYHDMGLIGFMISPIMSQVSLDLMEPSSFARRPLTWLDLMTRNGGTLSYSPSFGYELCVKRWRNDRQFDLSGWRAAGIGGDMVRSEVLEAFAETFADHGFNPNAFVPSYGMAEATLAIAFAPLNEPLKTDTVDNDRLGRTNEAVPASDLTKATQERTFVACGRIMPGHEAEIRDDNGQPLGERQVGRICVRGPSVTPGYYQNEEATKAAFTEDGWLETGDLGYWLDGQVVVTGRSKDLILWHGKNIWPQDLEWAAEEAVNGRIGRLAAFAVEEADGTDAIRLLIECRTRDPEALHTVHGTASSAVSAAAGVPVNIQLVPLSSLVVTSSGKISRARARSKYLAGGFEDLLHANREVDRVADAR